MDIQNLEVLEKRAIEGILAIKNCQGDLLRKLIVLYQEESPILISEIAEGIKKADVGQIRASSHSLKSTSATLGAMQLADYAKDLELMARGSDVTNAPGVLADLKLEYARVVKDLKKLMAST